LLIAETAFAAVGGRARRKKEKKGNLECHCYILAKYDVASNPHAKKRKKKRGKKKKKKRGKRRNAVWRAQVPDKVCSFDGGTGWGGGKKKKKEKKGVQLYPEH